MIRIVKSFIEVHRCVFLRENTSLKYCKKFNSANQMSYVVHQNKKVKMYFYHKILLFVKLRVLSIEREIFLILT